ncbi:MAG: hypothetical protein NUV54_01275 [Candidatus Taylorbacteria bacterium]|nr:hypothetical protein [Candidatus Taylorbacteria bacterium]
MKISEKMAEYKRLLPARITVKIEKNKDEQGFWAQVLGLPHVYTQASSLNELAGMITDAIQTHFEIPEKYRKSLGYYIPVSQRHIQAEEMFRRLVAIEKKVESGKEVRQIFSRSGDCVVA